MNIDQSIYIQNGYENRDDYLKNLAEEYGWAFDTVKMFSDLLSPTEDFDGLINFLEESEF